VRLVVLCGASTLEMNSKFASNMLEKVDLRPPSAIWSLFVSADPPRRVLEIGGLASPLN